MTHCARPEVERDEPEETLTLSEAANLMEMLARGEVYLTQPVAEETARLLRLADRMRDTLRRIRAGPNSWGLCEGCPPDGYPSDKTRCAECPRRNVHPKGGKL